MTVKPNLTLNPNPKLTSGVAGGLFPYDVFTPTPIPSRWKFQYDPGQFAAMELRCVDLSFLCFYPIVFCLVRTRCSVCLSGASYLAPTRFAAEYCLTHAITHHRPKTNTPDLAQIWYMDWSHDTRSTYHTCSRSRGQRSRSQCDVIGAKIAKIINNFYYTLWSRDTKSTTSFQGQLVKGQGQSVMWCISTKKSLHFMNG